MLLTTIDKVAFPFACLVASAFSSLRKRSLREIPLIVRPGGMGDLIICSAALEELQLNPRDFHWLIERRSQGWACHRELPYTCYDDLSLKNAQDLLRLVGSFPLVVDTEQLYGLSGSFARLSAHSSGRLFGFQTNRASPYVTHHSVPYDRYDAHELTMMAQLFSQAFLPNEKAPLLKRLELRKRQYPHQFYTVVSLSGSGNPARAFNADTWITMIQRYVDLSDPIMITAAPHDRALAHEIQRAFDPSVEVLEGNFESLCETIQKAQRMFTLDGGPVHIASYYGVPVDAVFTSGRSGKWHPWSQASQIIRHHELSCQPCTLFGATPTCTNEYACKEKAQWQTFPVERL